MCGWFSAATARASRSEATCPGSTLIATSRPSRVSRARYTSPMPPFPMGARISYGPRRVPAERGIGSCDYVISRRQETRSRMRVIAWALLALWSGDVLPPLLLAGDPGNRAQYVGGTVAGLPSKSEGNIDTTDGEVLLFRAKQATVRIPYNKINTIEYGQRVNRRIDRKST